jgi:hypothetical protein
MSAHCYSFANNNMLTCLRSCFLWVCIFTFVTSYASASDQAVSVASSSPPAASSESGTTSDLFIMPGADFVRPGLKPKTNFNVGLGHTFSALHKDPFGDELTFAYTYENAGMHGFWHTPFGSHTEAAGIMKDFSIPKAKALGAYTWIQLGLTSLTGSNYVQNRLYSGEAGGVVVHLSSHDLIWLQETYKIVTTSWYTSTNVGYVWSW